MENSPFSQFRDLLTVPARHSCRATSWRVVSIAPTNERKIRMKRMVCILSALVCALVLAVSAIAQSTNVTGDWDVTINSPQGARQGKISFKQEGAKLTGTLKNQRGDVPIEGEVTGKEIKFKY